MLSVVRTSSTPLLLGRVSTRAFFAPGQEAGSVGAAQAIEDAHGILTPVEPR
jgi:hypothetical protein